MTICLSVITDGVLYVTDNIRFDTTTMLTI